MRRDRSGLRDRVLAAVEIVALGTWVGALVGFAFIFAPLSFALVAPLDVGRFATLTAMSIGLLTRWGYLLGGIAAVAAIVRSIAAGDRVWDAIRVGLIVGALAFATLEQRAIVPRMEAIADTASPAYHALHQQSSAVYGAALLLAVAALVLAAARRDE